MEFTPFKAFLPSFKKLNETPIDNPNIINAGTQPDWSYSKILESSNPRLKLDMFKSKGWLKQTLLPKLYLYKQVNENNFFTGIIGLTSVYDFHKGVIKPHEKTIPKREKIFTEYLDNIPVHAEPVCLTTNNKEYQKIILEEPSTKPIIQFTKNGKEHFLWELENDKINAILNITENIEEVYIADGHHRMASSVQYFSENNENPSSQYFLSVLIPASNLKIHPFHREIQVNKSQKKRLENFINEKNFLQIRNLPQKLVKNEIIIEFDGKKFLKKVGLFDEETPYGYINQNILGPILNIHDIKRSKKIKYFPGNKSIPEYSKELEKSESVKIYLPSLTFEKIKHFSDNNLYLPPKSSWILPKMLTGLTIFDIRNH